jgi:hypothetical protein
LNGIDSQIIPPSPLHVASKSGKCNLHISLHHVETPLSQLARWGEAFRYIAMLAAFLVAAEGAFLHPGIMELPKYVSALFTFDTIRGKGVVQHGGGHGVHLSY